MTISDPHTPAVSMQPTSTTVLWSGHSEDLANLASGALTAEEFSAAKAKLLA